MASKAELISNINVFAEIAAFDCYLPIISEKRRVAHLLSFLSINGLVIIKYAFENF